MGARRDAKQAAEYAQWRERADAKLNAQRTIDARNAVFAAESQGAETKQRLERRVVAAERRLQKAERQGRPPAIMKGRQQELDRARAAVVHHKRFQDNTMGRLARKLANWL